jgi:predicted Ser/Thr protein kinase
MDHQTPPSIAETVAVGAESISSITSSASSVVEEGRFAPGTLLGGRYRIIGLLGRGGMGEVYRATDLMLGQPVALKFLPEEARQNPRLLERFHGEVRVARLVSHPNVCRVYDIGEIEGMPFLSMEYVDGEDLASLLTRIGRLPADKAIETARKLCAGIAAAHDRGVIHRDLKPQNIMINKRGEVVIMDFGLAAITDQLTGAEARNGTPAYMSPEQLRGTGVTSRSDIYALGLVLYELFTGKRPYDAKSLRQLMDLQESLQITSMTSIASEIDPAVEKVIRRCLDPDPEKRPPTALAVMVALPGGDPLAAALAAGETPSPEIVAAHGQSEGMALRYSIPCLALICATLLATPFLTYKTRAMYHAPLDSSPDVLAHRSREVAASFGYSRRPEDSALWMEHRGELVRYLREMKGPKRWEEWLAAEAPIRSIYRESPAPLVALPYGEVTATNPAPTRAGMVQVNLDGNGKLLAFSGRPYDSAPDLTPPVPPDAVFRAAGFDVSTFQEVAPSGAPLFASDTLRAWTGPHPKIPNTPVTVRIAWWKGRVTDVLVTYPYTAASAETGSAAVQRVSDWLSWIALAIGLIFVALLARRNWRLDRSDRKGALRLATAQFVLSGLGWLGWVHPVPRDVMVNLTQASLANWLFWAAVVWVVYLALEPAVRARWPHSIVTWNRLLAGRWMDSQVGAHILIGAVVGCAVWAGFQLLGIWLSHADELAYGGMLDSTLGTRHWIGVNASMIGNALRFSMIGFFMIFGLRRLLQKDWAAAGVAAVVFTMLEGEVTHSSEWQLVVPIYIVVYALLIFVLLRFGLVATVAAIVFANSTGAITIGADWRAWYVPSGLATMLLLFGIAVFAFWRSLGSRDLLGGTSAG